MIEKEQNSRKRGYATSEVTRLQLIETGIKVFGKYGYHAATTRMLAQTARVTLSAIPYHFGGKEGLYLAVLQTVNSKLAERIANEQKKIVQVIQDPDATREEMFDALDAMMKAWRWTIVAPRSDDALRSIMLHEHIKPSPVFDQLYAHEDTGMGVIHEQIGMLVARLTNANPTDTDVILRAHSIIGQMLAFDIDRDVLLRRAGWKEVTAEHANEIIDVLIANIHYILNAKFAENAATRAHRSTR